MLAGGGAAGGSGGSGTGSRRHANGLSASPGGGSSAFNSPRGSAAGNLDALPASGAGGRALSAGAKRPSSSGRGSVVPVTATAATPLVYEEGEGGGPATSQRVPRGSRPGSANGAPTQPQSSGSRLAVASSLHPPLPSDQVPAPAGGRKGEAETMTELAARMMRGG